MFNTPTDCYNYIIENDLEMPVLGAMMNHVGGYSIAEIVDGRFHNRDGAVSFSSPGYKINIPVTDETPSPSISNITSHGILFFKLSTKGSSKSSSDAKAANLA